MNEDVPPIRYPPPLSLSNNRDNDDIDVVVVDDES
jgi:hypothetical protein